jgi:ketosteroid isomerase-like protein
MIRLRFAALVCAAVSVAALAPLAFAQKSGTDADRAALTRTGDAIRAGFAAGDVDAIMKYHHPDVEKWLGGALHTVGRDALRTHLVETFKSVGITFADNRVESTLFVGDTAVEVSDFTIHVTPKNGGAPSDVKGRAMVVYVRSPQSPTGWLSIRELIQPVE